MPGVSQSGSAVRGTPAAAETIGGMIAVIPF
jgi:hypothetical protein